MKEYAEAENYHVQADRAEAEVAWRRLALGAREHLSWAVRDLGLAWWVALGADEEPVEGARVRTCTLLDRAKELASEAEGLLGSDDICGGWS